MMPDLVKEKQWFTKAWYALGLILICRVLANFFIPLNEHTESRYGEIARKMLETNNWVTLQQEYGIPFWAKPPLSTWLSALSMKLFGINEFALRLPALLLSIAVLALIGSLANRRHNSNMAMMSVLVLTGCLYFFIDAGVIMTEPSLIFCITICFVGFWRAISEADKTWSYLFFVGLGLGLLAKGPIALVLVGLPVFFWVLIQNQWVNLWKRLPWISGTLLMLFIALPWYLLAEKRTPGFLNYFIVGEHIHRFLTPGWDGDKYGFAHLTPKGIIWLYALAGFLPWSAVGGWALVKRYKEIPNLIKDEDGWLSYLLLFTLAPLAFFTMASNVIYPYTFPALPAFSLFFAEMYMRMKTASSNPGWICYLSTLSAGLVLIVTGLFVFKPLWVANTQKAVIQAWTQKKPVAGSKLIYWSNGNEFSAQFYAHGAVVFVQNQRQLCDALSGHDDNYLVVYATQTFLIPQSVFSQFKPLGSIWVRHNEMKLLHAGSVDNCSQGLVY